MTSQRYAYLLDYLKQAGMDGLVLNPSPTLTYLTGLHFHLMERPVVLIIAPPHQPVLILPELELVKVQSSLLPLQTFSYGDNPAEWQSIFDAAIKTCALNNRQVGVETTWLRFLELNYLHQAAPNTRFISGDAALVNLRSHKDAEEVAAMRKAVQIAQQALLATLPFIRPGVTERQVASELTLQLLRAGSDSPFPFNPIVASGPNSANPHAVPTDRVLTQGDLLIIDWGATCEGYISDLTRTFAIGPVDAELTQIAQIVAQANAAGRAAAAPNIPAGQVDQQTRTVIEQAGYGAQFFHRTGHGIGMEPHEAPYIFGENQVILEPGMAFTVEPGIYLAGRGGVRIEDNLIITAAGADCLSDLPRQLIELPL